MKIFINLLFVLFPFIALAQDNVETSKPSLDTEIVRHCAFMEIEGDFYSNVTITLKSQSPAPFVSDNFRVKVTVKNSDGKNVYKKTFKNSYLYIFSEGEIQVGKPKFNQIMIGKRDDKWWGIIKEKEGIW